MEAPKSPTAQQSPSAEPPHVPIMPATQDCYYRLEMRLERLLDWARGGGGGHGVQEGNSSGGQATSPGVPEWQEGERVEDDRAEGGDGGEAEVQHGRSPRGTFCEAISRLSKRQAVSTGYRLQCPWCQGNPPAPPLSPPPSASPAPRTHPPPLQGAGGGNFMPFMAHGSWLWSPTHATPRMVTCGLSRVGCWLRRRQHNMQHMQITRVKEKLVKSRK